MVNFIKKPILISGEPELEEKKGSSFRGGGRKRPTLKELQERKYLFPDSNLLGMLEYFPKNGIVKLPPST